MLENVHFLILVFRQPLSFYSLCLEKEKSSRTGAVYISKLAELWAACRSTISSFPQTKKSFGVHQPWADLRQYPPLQTTAWM